MLCSILIPSRKRFNLLLRSIKSIIASAKGKDFEIIVRLHNDDYESLGRQGELGRFGMVRVIGGETLNGYASLNEFFNELEPEAKGDWRWHINDDMTVFTEGDLSSSQNS
jgi:hypothetical protein